MLLKVIYLTCVCRPFACAVWEMMGMHYIVRCADRA